MSMSVFVHQSGGKYIGCDIVVIAGHKKTAEKMIRDKLTDMGLVDDEVTIISETKIGHRPFIALENDGDY